MHFLWNDEGINDIPGDDLNSATGERIRVVVIGESLTARAGLEAAISESDEFEVVGACNLAGSAEVFESAAAVAVLLEGCTFKSWNRIQSAPERVSAQNEASVVLTPRETDVLKLMVDGASNKVIAHKLSIAAGTVKFHVMSILSKLNAGTRTEAVTLGVRMGLVHL